jgi:hypothetical protein
MLPGLDVFLLAAAAAAVALIARPCRGIAANPPLKDQTEEAGAL